MTSGSAVVYMHIQVSSMRISEIYEPTKKYTTAQGQENTKIISEDEFLELVE